MPSENKKKNEYRLPFAIHSRGSYVEKSKWIYILILLLPYKLFTYKKNKLLI
ncbi:hypothetical protein bcere0022_29150 [Bacillus cereus Rock3-44]|nr:hypothetical protein bcere0022_29150 [Bacillus cereus Rock3-44]